MITISPVAEILILALTLTAQTPPADTQAVDVHSIHAECRPPRVIPLTDPEPAARLIVERPLPGPLASRGVVVIPYCAENMRIAAVFGPGALAVSPRIGHVHVTVDGAPWHWADASGTPIILRGLPSGVHQVLLELVDANHQVVDKGTVAFEVPVIKAARSQF